MRGNSAQVNRREVRQEGFNFGFNIKYKTAAIVMDMVACPDGKDISGTSLILVSGLSLPISAFMKVNRNRAPTNAKIWNRAKDQLRRIIKITKTNSVKVMTPTSPESLVKAFINIVRSGVQVCWSAANIL